MPAECIEWTGAVTNGGYGQLSAEGRHWQAHRYAWYRVHGEIPAGMVVMHVCDNPLCVNVDHLRLGTQADNMVDMVTKGRCYQTVKTHCPQGHEYSTENTYFSGRGTERQCRICRAAQQVEVGRRRKEMRRARRAVYESSEHA